MIQRVLKVTHLSFFHFKNINSYLFFYNKVVMPGSPKTLLPPSSMEVIKMPTIGLIGCDEVSGVKYVDITKLDSTLVAPFMKMLVRDDGLAAMHYFSEVKEHVNGSGDILIVGKTLMCVCDKNANITRQIHLTNIKSLIVSNTGYEWIGFSLSPAANQPDLMMKPRTPEFLISIIKSLYIALTNSELPVVRTDNISGCLQLNGTISKPNTIIPLSTVKPIPHRLWISSNTGIDGWYQFQPSDVNSMEYSYVSRHGYLLQTDATGRWGLYQKQDLVFRASIEGSKPQEIKQWQKFDKLENEWCLAPECSVGIHKKAPSLDNLIPPRNLSPGSIRRSPTEAKSPILYETMSLKQLKSHVINKTELIKDLKRTAAEQTSAIASLQRDTQFSQRDNNSVEELLEIQVGSTGESHTVIQCANIVIASMEAEALKAESDIGIAQASIQKIRSKNEETIALESSLRQQIAASETIQIDSKEKLNTIRDGTRELVERSQAIALEKERRVGELATLRAMHSDEMSKLKSQQEVELTPLQRELVNLEKQLRKPPAKVLSEQNNTIQNDITSLEAQLQTLRSEEVALQEKHSSVLDSHVKANNQLLVSSDGQSESMSPITVACDQLSAVLLKLDILEQHANECGTLRWHLERATEKAEDMDSDIRNAILKMKEIKSVYDQRILHATMELETSQMCLSRAETHSSEVSSGLKEDLETLKHKSISTKKNVMSKVSELNTLQQQLREESTSREAKKRWSFEQELFLARCNRNPSPSVEPASVQQMVQLDCRIQAIDKELLKTQQTTLQIDTNEHEMKQKRDAAIQTLVAEEEQIRSCGVHTPEDTEYQLQHLREKMFYVEQNMEQFLSKITQRRMEIDHQGNTLLREKESLMSKSNQLRQQEASL